MAENTEVRSLIESILKNSGPTEKGDFVATFSAMQNSMMVQIDLSRRILNTLEESLAFNREKEADRRRDDLLRDQERKDEERGTPESGSKDKPSSGSGSLADLLTASFRNVYGALAAFQLAAAGLRGWETRAISVLTDTLRSVSDSAVNGLNNIRNTLSNLPSVAGQISQRLENLRVNALRLFDLGPDGRPLNIRGADGRFTGYTVVGRVSARILELLQPLRNVANGISSFISGAGSSIYSSPVFTTIRGFSSGVTGLIGQLFTPISNAASGISSFISGAGSAIFNSSLFSSIGSFASTVGRILRPLGFLVSAYDGVTTYLDTEGSRYERFVAGISAFIGDFVGAPLNLLGRIVSWALEQLGFDETAEGVGDFDFDELISNMVGGLFSLAEDAVDYVRTLFSFDPEQEGSILNRLGNIGSILYRGFISGVDYVRDLFTFDPEGYGGRILRGLGNVGGILFSGFLRATNFVRDLFTFDESDQTLLGRLGNLIDIVFAPVNLAVNFVRGMFGFDEGEQEEPFRLSTFIGETIGNAVDWVRDRVSGIGVALQEKFMEFSEYIQSIPDRIRFAAERMWINLSERITIGFMEFGEWLGSLPSRLLVMAYDVIRSVRGGSLLVSDARYNEAVAALEERDGMSASIAAVRASAETRRIELAARENAAERARQARLDYVNQIAAQSGGGAGGAGGSVVANSGNVTTDARSNTTYNYYTSQDPSRAIDPSIASGPS